MSKAKCEPIKWTEERRQFVEENIYHTPYARLTEMFNEYFEVEISVNAMRVFAKRNKLKNGFDGKFSKGRLPHNKGQKMPPEVYEKAKATMFKKGQRPPKWRPCGSERISKDGYIEVKVDGTRRWQLKHRIMWEKVNGPIPKGHALLFLDGDKTNCELSNLKLIRKDARLIMNMNKMNYDNSVLNEASSNLATLIAKQFEAKRNRKERENGNDKS